MATKPSLQDALEEYFGFEKFRQGQVEAIQRVIQGQHTLLVMPTGSGKSLTYQLPGQVLPHLTLVISPLISLMHDQVEDLLERGIAATYLNSSLPPAEISRRMRAVQEGHIKLLYVAPERLRHRQFTQALARLKISLLAVDEAHCLSQWGHDFRPDYLHIGPTWQALGQPPLIATTATATPTVQKDIIRLLDVPQAQTLVTGFNRPNLYFQARYIATPQLKLQALHHVLQENMGAGRAIVYAATRRNVDDVTTYLQHQGFSAASYHAGLPSQLRTEVQQDFMQNRLQVVVATNAFGMGINKADVRVVVHYNMPATLEAYYQEAGRAGRDGEPAQAVLLFSPDDQRLHEWMIHNDHPEAEDLSQVYQFLKMGAQDEVIYITAAEIAAHIELHEVKVRVVLSELEQAGAIYYLERQGAYTKWRILSFEEAGLTARLEAIGRRREARLGLLQTMLDYVHLRSCRRAYVMAYFGDTGPPSAEVCCDNHREMRVDTLPKATTAEEWFPLIVLETARSLPYPVGRHRLSQIVTGSKAKVMQEQKYNQHKFYGKLSQLSQPQALSLIDNLLNEGYLQLSRGELPILEVSESGLQALEHRAALPIQVQGGVGQLPQGKVGADFKEDKGASGSTGMVVGDVVGDAKSIEATILETVSKLNGVLGRTGLAKFLTGSKAKWLEEFKTHSGYGQLSYLTQKAAIEVIDNLITAGQLRTTSSLRPKVKLVDELGGEEQNPSPATQLEVEAPTSTPSESVKPETEESKKAVPQPSQKWPEEQLEGAILQVVTDLAGLVSLQSVARLLTAKPNSIVPFSDHPLSGQFQNVSQKELEGLIRRMMLQEKIKSSPKGKLYK